MSTLTSPQVQAQGPECPICLGIITKTNRAVLDPCRHDFDYNCIKEWTKVSSNCPVCRCPVSVIHYSIVSDREYSEETVKPVVKDDDDIGSDDEYDDEVDDFFDGVDADFGSESEFDEDDEDVDVNSNLNSDEEWEDISDVEEIILPEDDFQDANDGDDSVQVIEGEAEGIFDLEDDTINETVHISDSEIGDDDDRPSTPGYGDDPGDGGQSEDDHFNDDFDDGPDEDDHYNDVESDLWEEANDDFDGFEQEDFYSDD